jgi:predicted nucleotidyltransferase
MITKDYILTIIENHKPEFFRFGVHSIGLFGSYVRNEQNEKSDIDLLIDFDPEKENFDNYMALCDFLELLFKDEKVEVVTKNGLSPYIGPSILKEVRYV